MSTAAAAQPMEDEDAAIEAAVAEANVPALLAAVADLTGDVSLLTDDVRPLPDHLLEPDQGLTPSQVAEARTRAAAALRRHRGAGSPPAPSPAGPTLRRMIEFVVGAPVGDDYAELLTEELARDRDHREPGWQKDEVAADRDFEVVIVGAGMSGLLAGHRLQQAGVPFVIIEKNDDVGGTWLENTYPGCRVDVPNHLYSYSFAQSSDWPGFFSTQEALLEYFRSCADTLGLRPHIRFGTEVVDARFDEHAGTWRVRVRSAAGDDELDASAVVSAVGQLNRPNMPDIPGIESFEGAWFHSARWDHGVDLAGKRVAIIGTGASAAQFIPAVAEQAGHLTVFQRTPPWLVPTPNYHDPIPDGVRWLLQHVPAYARWDRLSLFWRSHEGLLPMAAVDPDWDNGGLSVSAPNELVRQLLSAYLRVEFPDDDIYAKVLPAYPPIAKRVVRDNGAYTRAISRSDVELVTDRIAEITPAGVRTTDGAERGFDVVIYGTGFTASQFLTPMRVTGKDGRDLHETWAGDARAYLGITVPGFPNLFLLYGPNTNIVINGSIVYFSECEVHYVLRAIHHLLSSGHRWLDCRPGVHDAYNERIDAGNRAMAWGAAEVNSWYRNATGRVAQNWPFSLLEYWQQTREVDPADYDFG